MLFDDTPLNFAGQVAKEKNENPGDRARQRGGMRVSNPTSQYITQIEADGDLNVALANFNTVCIANATTLGLKPADLTEIAAAATGFNTNLNAWVAARSTANNAKDTKNTQKTTSKGVVSKWAKSFRANPAVPDALLGQLMLPPHKTPGSKTPPTTPLDLVANSTGQGLVKLTWKRNGNTSTTVFQIETRDSVSSPWVMLDSTTKTKYDHQATPGVYIAFRVSAKRGTLTSAPSVPVVLWENGGESATNLKLAA